MLNTQTPEKRVHNADGILSVHSIFHTIQGEGPFCGYPAVFVRLAGCNLQCPLCDTEYTQGRRPLHPDQILEEIYRVMGDTRNTRLIVVTGGEPFRQDLAELFDALTKAGYFVQVETNGTLDPPDDSDSEWKYSDDFNHPDGVYIVCSPKAGKVRDKIHEEACCYKYVGSFGNLSPIDGLPMHPLEHPSLNGVPRPRILKDYRAQPRYRPVYLQPTDHKDYRRGGLNDKSLAAVVESCMKHGYILQLQTHKIIGVE